MEDWRTGSLKERPQPNQISSAVLLRTARERIWVHWVLWMVPFVNFVGGIISAVRIKDWRPLGVAFGIGFIIGVIGGAATGGALLIVAYLLNAVAAGWTQQIIQEARDEIDRRNAR